ncbi:DUF2514 family protein [Achromobacter sp. PAB15]|uniref:DUF2514 family protein n=1 Tax=Achromobacter sp. PAB15 TaxID=3233048 RepID=UPI003F8D9EC3
MRPPPPLEAAAVDLFNDAVIHDPAAAGGSLAGTTALDLLVYMLGRVSDRAEELAAFADRARIAGLKCEGIYERALLSASAGWLYESEALYATAIPTLPSGNRYLFPESQVTSSPVGSVQMNCVCNEPRRPGPTTRRR